VDLTAGGGRAVESITLRNDCEGTLQLTDVRIDSVAPESTFSLASPPPQLVQAGSSVTVDVAFEPAAVDTYRGDLVVESNAPDDPTKVVRLEGNADGPRIILSPTAYDYGSPYIGCETSQVVEIRNRGTQDLTVSDIQVFTSSPDQFSVDLAPLDNGPLPWTLGPYQDDRDGPISEFWVDYLPIDTFSDDGLVQVQSNDPLTPVATVEVKGTGTVFGNNTDSFEYDATPQVDALFVLDRSSDTRDALRTLDEAIPALQTTLSDASIDYRLAAVVSDDGCIAGAEPWIDATLTGSDATLAFEVMADVDERLVPYGDETYLLDRAVAATSKDNLGAGGCNEGFVRPGGRLAIVFVSGNVGEGSWSSAVATLQSVPRRPEDLVLHAVAGDYPSGCGTYAPGRGYYEATVSTGGAFLSLCRADDTSAWERMLGRPLLDVDSGPWFELSQQPVPGSIEVTVDGVPRNEGWAYDIGTNNIVLDPPPEDGTKVEVYYERLPSCEG